MAPRLELQQLLRDLLGSDNVYFQPPPNIQMQYPCIIYRRINHSIQYADNAPYKNKKRYQITIVDSNPDSIIPDKIAALPMCLFDRYFATDNLNHDIYNVFF